MIEGKPSYEQMCRIVGSIYADAFLRIEFLENENRQLREDGLKVAAAVESLREENETLKKRIHDCEQIWNNGNENSTSQESLPEKLASAWVGKRST